MLVKIPIRTENIKLDSFLKWAGVVQTGGEAKQYIQNGQIQVNKQVETRRGRVLVGGDEVSVLGKDEYLVCLSDKDE